MNEWVRHECYDVSPIQIDFITTKLTAQINYLISASLPPLNPPNNLNNGRLKCHPGKKTLDLQPSHGICWTPLSCNDLMVLGHGLWPLGLICQDKCSPNAASFKNPIELLCILFTSNQTPLNLHLLCLFLEPRNFDCFSCSTLGHAYFLSLSLGITLINPGNCDSVTVVSCSLGYTSGHKTHLLSALVQPKFIQSQILSDILIFILKSQTIPSLGKHFLGGRLHCSHLSVKGSLLDFYFIKFDFILFY